MWDPEIKNDLNLLFMRKRYKKVFEEETTEEKFETKNDIASGAFH